MSALVCRMVHFLAVFGLAGGSLGPYGWSLRHCLVLWVGDGSGFTAGQPFGAASVMVPIRGSGRRQRR